MSSVLSLSCCGQFTPLPPLFPEHLLCAGVSACYLMDSSQPPREVRISCPFYTHDSLELRGGGEAGLGRRPASWGPKTFKVTLWVSSCTPLTPSDTWGTAPPPIPTVSRACGFCPQQPSSQAPLPPPWSELMSPLTRSNCLWAPLAVPLELLQASPPPFLTRTSCL